MKGRILAIDYGTKRVGIAVTDPLQLIATHLKTVHSEELISFLKEYILNESVVELVIGQPKRLDGSLSGPIEALNNFKRFFIKAFPNIPLKEVDERFTSKLAFDSMIESGLKKSKRKNKEEIDLISAVIILQSYLEQKKL